MIKSREEIKLIRKGGILLSGILERLKKEAVVGKTTIELDQLAEELILSSGGKPSFKNYGGFPASICTSIDDEVVHGIPSERALKSGELLSIDIGMLYQGFHTDMATTIAIGEIDSEASRLIRTTKKALKRGIKKVRPGATLGDIGNTIQRSVESQGFFVIECLCGHGIGRNLHEEPLIYNVGRRRMGMKLIEGMVICIEPMVSVSCPDIVTDKDGFTVRTRDGSLSAHFEHTIAVTSDGAEVLTL